MVTPPYPASAALAELGSIDYSTTDLRGVLQRIADLAKRTLPGATAVSMTMLEGGRPTTAAFTDDVATRLDQSQYDAGHGPCLDAAEGGATVLIPDLGAEDRWSHYTTVALENQVYGSLAMALPVQHLATGALNVYCAKPFALDDEDIQAAELFAGHAAVAVANAQAFADSTALVEQLREAMRSRAVIEQAKGILMAQHRCDAEEAFDLLSRASQRENRKLRDLAAGIVESTAGRRPA